MPSGRTHDSITLWSLPLVAGCTFGWTQSGNLALIVSGSFLFSGLMFGPDLDIYSQQYKRWGWLRWIWLPYRKSMRHRSLLSHGILIGTVLRVLYLTVWIAILGTGLLLGSAIIQHLLGTIDAGSRTAQLALETSTQLWQRSLQQHPQEWVAGLIGLELGSLSHSLSDWAGSTYNRVKKRGKQRRSGKPKP